MHFIGTESTPEPVRTIPDLELGRKTTATENQKEESGMALLQRIAARDNCPFATVGTATG